MLCPFWASPHSTAFSLVSRFPPVPCLIFPICHLGLVETKGRHFQDRNFLQILCLTKSTAHNGCSLVCVIEPPLELPVPQGVTSQI